MNRFSKMWKVGALAGVLALGLTSCAGSGVAGGQSTPAGDGPQGVLRTSNFIETSSFDPAATVVQAGVPIFAVYDTLLSYDSKGELAPWLATKWSQPDAMTWRFELREDVVFHDGSTFDANTVKLNLDRAKGLTASPYAYIYGQIKSVEVVDATTVEVHFNTAWPSFADDMAQVSGAMISPKAIQEKQDLTRNPAGSGGWIWDKEAHVESSLHRLEANPNYWNPDAVRAAKIEVHILPDANARLNGLESGQLDIAARLPARTWDAAESAGMSLNGSYIETSSLYILDREGKVAPALAEPKVREAIGLLLDRNAFVNVIQAGHSDAVAGGFAAPGSTFYAPEIDATNPPEADVDKAKQLLSEAGYPDGFSYKQGTTTATRQQDETIAQMLSAGGIKVELVDIVGGQYGAEYRKGTYPIGFFSPVSNNPWEWWVRQVSNNGPYNPFKLNDLADLEAKFEEARGSTDVEVQKKLIAELQQAVIDRGVMFPLSPSQLKAGIAQDVGGTDKMIQGPRDMAPRPYFLAPGS
jgi:peptide/nickel transport system substrate-binding protein